MDSAILQAVPECVHSFFISVTMQDGGGWLPSHLDPCRCNGPYGVNVQMRSVQDQHLTYSSLKASSQGLLNVSVR